MQITLTKDKETPKKWRYTGASKGMDVTIYCPIQDAQEIGDTIEVEIIDA